MSALSPRQMWLLDEACKPIEEALGTPYLVGTAAHRGAYRDVDVRVILSDKHYRKLKRAIGQKGITLMGFTIGDYLAHRTGLPIDFQIQQMTAANALHEGIRNPLGGRDLSRWPGDAAPVAQPAVSGPTEGDEK